MSGDTITMAGRPSDHTENGLKFAQQVKVVPEGGNLSVENGAIVVNGADAITIYMSAGTNYQVDGSTEYNYFSSEDPLGAVRSRVNTAAAKGVFGASAGACFGLPGPLQPREGKPRRV